MAGGEVPGARDLEQTPTWAVSAVCAAMIVISIILEKFLHNTGQWFKKKHNTALFDALEKVKTELMVLGFISLTLTFSQSYIVGICVPLKYANTMLPCAQDSPKEPVGGEEEHRRRLLWYHRRFLAGDSASKECQPGYVQPISVEGMHQLHIFIFFLAVFHVVYSAITMMLGRLKFDLPLVDARGMLRMRSSEQMLSLKNTQLEGMGTGELVGARGHECDEEVPANFTDPARFRLTHETSFVCFFRQFFRSVRKSDYLTMRHGFISVHLAPGSKFNFQNYIKKTLEDDFKVVVGISPLLWASAILNLLTNVHGWKAQFCVSFLPLFVTLAVGTKLQAIIAQMAIEIKERHAVVQGIPLVQVSDRNFWFSWPELVLYLIHFVLFQYEFGSHSCLNQDSVLIITRVTFGIGAQVLCSYATLPLYALVTQMGSTMKRSIFDQQTSKALKNWHKKAVKKSAEGPSNQIPTRTLGGSPDDSSVHSPSSTPHRTKKLGNKDPDFSDVEAELASHQHTANIMATVDLSESHQRQPSDSNYSSGQRDLLTDGLKYYDVLEGKGPVAGKGMTVQVHFDCLYRGITAVSSRESKLLAGNRIIAQPYEFKVGTTPGKERKREFVDNPNGLFSAQAAPKPPPAMYSVTEGMKVGGKRTVIVPPEAGYGQKGMNEIPAGSTFELNIELLQVMPAEGK
ncbi:unnamed protein product [Dovyalis caffra]|uniref:peptidylprolyl isomerase n=1 Tax=Dovyalis caffra TaxID=77055 RepID=A0AAV1S511_9ROSI|nr:unnamed protein product [Dovyalis caffra]